MEIPGGTGFWQWRVIKKEEAGLTPGFLARVTERMVGYYCQQPYKVMREVGKRVWMIVLV